MTAKTSNIAALWCWYHGGAYKGYQTQLGQPTVQDTLKQALNKAGFSRTAVASSRTDAGVHARMQILSFRLVEDVPLEQVARLINQHLPSDVGVKIARPAPLKFHPLWKCSSKEYRYHLVDLPNETWEHCAWHTGFERTRLLEVLNLFVGSHNFRAFHDKSSSEKIRTITDVQLKTTGPATTICIRGSGFARYQVRLLVGAAVGVSNGTLKLDQVKTALETGIRFEGIRAPAHGLVLWNVTYPQLMDPFSEDDRLEMQFPYPFMNE